MTHPHAPVRIPQNPPPPAAGCAFPDGRRADGLCGREPVAVYVNPFTRALNTLRCERHDRDGRVHAAAADRGFRRIPLVSKDEKNDRIEAVEKVERGA